MRRLSLLCVLLSATPAAQPQLAHGAQAQLAPPVPGSTLPVRLLHSLDRRHAAPGTPIVASLTQRVPLPSGNYLPAGAQLLGSFAPAPPAQLALLFTTLRWHLRAGSALLLQVLTP